MDIQRRSGKSYNDYKELPLEDVLDHIKWLEDFKVGLDNQKKSIDKEISILHDVLKFHEEAIKRELKAIDDEEL